MTPFPQSNDDLAVTRSGDYQLLHSLMLMATCIHKICCPIQMIIQNGNKSVLPPFGATTQRGQNTKQNKNEI